MVPNRTLREIHMVLSQLEKTWSVRRDLTLYEILEESGIKKHSTDQAVVDKLKKL